MVGGNEKYSYSTKKMIRLLLFIAGLYLDFL